MIRGRTIICLASGYDAPPTSKHHVMHELARCNDVVWVNYHASRRPSLSLSDLRHLGSRLARAFRPRVRGRSNITVCTPLMAPFPSSRAARRLNRHLLARRLRRLTARLPAQPRQLWSFAPDAAYLLDGLDVERVLYYCVDDFGAFSGYHVHQVRQDEQALCRRADLVVTTSSALHQAKSPLNPRTLLVPHGVDFDHFSRAVTEPLAEPDDLAGLPHPRIAFFGLIRDWVDLELVAQVARRRPAWQFVFIGDWAVDVSPLRSVANVHLLGPRPYATLPGYCRHAEAAIIPFRINDLTLSVNPIKLREYLSAGLAVVSTPLPEVIAQGELVSVADGPHDFVAALERAMAEDPSRRAERMEAMRGETWPAKVDWICRELMNARSPAVA